MKMFLSVVVIVMLSLTAMAQEESAATSEAASTETVAVESVLIKSVAYDTDTQVLTIVLVKDDETYEYANVPEDVYNDLMAAESKGAYLVKNIKGKFETVKK